MAVSRCCGIPRDAPRGRIYAKSTKSTSPPPPLPRPKPSGKTKNQPTPSLKHQVRHPPSNSSGNIAPLVERLRSPSPREENHTKKEDRKAATAEQFEKVETTTSTTPASNTTTHIGTLNALPLKMLSPVLSNDTFQLQQQRKQQQPQQRHHRLLFPSSDDSKLILELLLGRLSACGIFGTTLVSMFTGQTLLEQVLSYPDNIILVSVAVLSSSFRVVPPRTMTEQKGGKKLQFLPVLESLESERFIGRVAMVVFSSVLAWQLLCFTT